MEVLITVLRGIVDKVVFFDDPGKAIESLSAFVKTMNPEHEDGYLYDQDGLIGNSRHFLNDNDCYMENPELIREVAKGNGGKSNE